MKTFLSAVALLVVLGVGGFLYRNALEQGARKPVASTACTLEAKICPDGTTVARSGPDCAFAACPSGNIEVPDSGLAFALPAGYVADENAAGADPTMIGAFIRQGTSTTPVGTIIIRDYPIPAGSSASAVMMAKAVKDPSGMTPTSMNAFTPEVIGSNTFETITLGQFEGTVSSAYFLPRSKDVLEFQIIETGVTNWNTPTMRPNTLPEHQALIKLLNTLQVTDPARAAASTATTTAQ